jgi:hypothetical protein
METSEIRNDESKLGRWGLQTSMFCSVPRSRFVGFTLNSWQRSQSLDDKYPENPTPQETAPSRPARLERLPIEWIIGPYVPVQERLKPLTNNQREQIYVRKTFLTAGSYVARAFSAELTRPAVNLTIGETGLPAIENATQPGMDSLSFRTAWLPDGMLFLGMSLDMTFAVAADFGLARATLYRETLWPTTGPRVNSGRKYRCTPEPSPPACSTTHGYRDTTT